MITNVEKIELMEKRNLLVVDAKAYHEVSKFILSRATACGKAGNYSKARLWQEVCDEVILKVDVLLKEIKRLDEEIGES